ncbi:MAG: U32 family peptidase, partial [Coriobacteriia bacterium]|nr:U32 family peptidase [Coriobacteriia bacterium]
WHLLRDAKRYAFPVTTDRLGRSHIYNSVPLDLSHVLGEVVDTGVAAVRLDMTMESPEEALRIVQHVRSGVRAASAGVAPTARVAEPGTTGHFFRGVR